MFLPVFGEPAIVKHALLPNDLIDYAPFSREMNKNSNILMGHNRWATQGAVNKTNAHPFEVGDISGAHNGTLKGQYLLADHRDFVVDSENIFHHINKHGAADMWSKLDGAAALTWWDNASKEFKVIRNSERPLFYCYSEDGRTMFYASEAWMLDAALGRNGIKYGTLYEFTEDHLYTFDVVRKHILPVGEGKIKPRILKLEPHFYPKYIAPKGAIDGNKKPADTLTNKNKGNLSLVGKSLTEFNAHLHTRRSCTAIEVCVTTYGVKYLRMSMDANPEIEVRMFINKAKAQSISIAKDFEKLTATDGSLVVDGTMQYKLLCNVVGNVYVMQSEDAEVAGVTGADRDDINDVRAAYDGVLVDETEFNDMFHECEWCTDELSFDDLDIVFTAERRGICGSCAEDIGKEYIESENINLGV